MTQTDTKPESDKSRTRLIDATLRVIAQGGVQAATVRSIAQEADVTQGLIRYYFKTKDELIAAAYETYMGNLVRVAADAAQETTSAQERLAHFIRVSLEAPITSHASVAAWAGFFNTLLHNAQMSQSHQRSYDILRLQLKEMIEDVFNEQGRSAEPRELRRLSIACNAVLDGLWLEGGALGAYFEPGELVEAGLTSFSALLEVDLTP